MTEVTWLSKEIRASKLTWAGHVARMEDGLLPWRVMNWRPVGRKPLGRRRTRWEDGMQQMMSDDWREEAADRNQWKALMEAPMSCRARELWE
ncbi:hypothetical protein E2C01_092625 [Portunus trituberculatus]|uniref:Uncharacterized protein n=1 Tax=Portunus trituberculatus TaxID=210409 RepID=A0A5B7JY88_PORTR|nr:hypothetical protein [Portunus trituberculatus]